MKIFAIELSTTHGSIALNENGKTLAQTSWIETFKNRQHLFDAMAELGVDWDGIEDDDGLLRQLADVLRYILVVGSGPIVYEVLHSRTRLHDANDDFPFGIVEFHFLVVERVAQRQRFCLLLRSTRHSHQ